MPGPGSRKSIEPDSPLVVAAGDPRRAFKESSLRYQIAARTCTIEDAAGWCGTGILVGPRHVLTNHHVIRDLLRPGADTGKTFCRFDYVKDTPTGKIYNGTQLFLRPEKW